MKMAASHMDCSLAVRNGTRYLYSPALESKGAQHFFTTKTERSDDSLPLDCLNGFVMVKQVHGDDVLIIDKPVEDMALFIKRAGQESCDAIITNQINTGICVVTADCLPVLLYDPVESVTAAVHAGWRGSIRKILTKVISRMSTVFSCRPENILAVMGPSIGPCCYTVGEAVTGPLLRTNPEWERHLVPLEGKKAKLDLSALNRHQAEDSGLLKENISGTDLCTYCREDLFFSYRRDGIGTGRMISGIFTES